MADFHITAAQLAAYERHLRAVERSAATREKYLRDLRAFALWLDGGEVTQESAGAWKVYLQARGYSPVTVNVMLSALNGFFRFIGRDGYRARFLKIQRKLFREQSRELTRPEYDRLLAAANETGRDRLAMLMETICATGIRVSEVRFITVEAARNGRTDVALKGKIRPILLPGKLCRKLLKYAKKHKIASGEIFLTRSGKGMTRRQIWAEMKAICNKAGVEASKVFPHNLRHLFARAFYKATRDIARLASVLGHSSIETTRIYLMTTGEEHARQLDKLGLVT